MIALADQSCLPAFAPQAPSGSSLRRLLWLLSSAGRVRRRWSAAHAGGHQAAEVAALETALQQLNLGRRPAEQRSLAGAALYLVWFHLRAGSPTSARRWFEQLDRWSDLEVRDRIPLRWQLIRSLCAANDVRGFLDQARRFAADRLVGASLLPAFLELTRAAYEEVSPQACAELLASANRVLAGSAPAKACLAVCRCPSTFESAEQAAAQQAAADPAQLGFSRRAMADALLIGARACEWRGDQAGMARQAEAAAEAAPDSLAARYWRLRAQLHGDTPAGGLEAGVSPSAPEWSRLALQLELHAHPSLASAASVVELLAPDSLVDPAERALVLKLLERGLALDFDWTDAELRQAAALCSRIEQSVGELSWTAVAIALAAMRLDAAPGVAIQRLEPAAVMRQRWAPELARAAAILSGATGGAPTCEDEAVFRALEAAMGRVLSPLPPGAEGNGLTAGFGLFAASAWWRRLPSLAALSTVLESALARMLPGSAKPAPALPTEVAPGWARWLSARVASLDRDSAAGPAEDVEDRPAALAWSLWNRLYCDPAGSPERTPADLDSLGPLCAGLIRSEDVLEAQWCAARESLGRGAAEVAVSALERLRAELSRAPLATQVVWTPVLGYWHGVALAQAVRPDADGVLRGLLGGPKDREARTQLALLAIRAGDLAAAESGCAGLAASFPALLYLRALLAERKGDRARARALLESFDDAFPDAAPTYRLAAHRLLAAIHERAGREEEAERAHASVLAEQPADPISAARLGRLRLRCAYAAARCGSLVPAEPAATWPAASGDAAVAWSRPLQQLHSLLDAGPAELDVRGERIDAVSCSPRMLAAWAQVVARRLLAAGRWREARDVLAGLGEAAPVWTARALPILDAWAALCGAWSPGGGISTDGTSKLASCLEKLETVSSRNEIHQRWMVLLRQALKWSSAEDAGFLPPVWDDLGQWPGALVCHLWAQDADTRRRAALALLPLLDRGAGWDEPHRRTLRALCQYASGQEEAFLQSYSEMESELDSLAVDGPALFVAAAGLWFRTRQWSRILDSELPDCVADLADDRVRMIVGLAYARAAAEDGLAGRVRQALQKGRQARGTLEGLSRAEEVVR